MQAPLHLKPFHLTTPLASIRDMARTISAAKGKPSIVRA